MPRSREATLAEKKQRRSERVGKRRGGGGSKLLNVSFLNGVFLVKLNVGSFVVWGFVLDLILCFFRDSLQ